MKMNNRSTFLILIKPLVLAKLIYQKHLIQQPTIELVLVVSLIVINEEHLLRALADTGASSSIVLEAYTSALFIKIDDSNTTTWSKMSGKFTKTRDMLVTFSLLEFNLKKQMCSS
jgi:hypothetical protein